MTSALQTIRTGVRLTRRHVRTVFDDLLPQSESIGTAAAVEANWQADERRRYCGRCGAAIGPGLDPQKPCPACPRERPAWDELVRLNAYSKPLDQWIVAMKFAGQWQWAPWLGSQLAAALDDLTWPRRAVVCAAPMPWQRRWRRGYDQAQLIAEAIAQHRRWTMAPLLRRVRYTRPQTHVPPARRRQNVAGAFDIAAVDLAGWDVVLVDDVKTTGATLSTCARLLRRAGAERIIVAVVAVADHSAAAFGHA